MKRLLATAMALTLMVGSTGIASAQPRDGRNDRPDQHDQGRGPEQNRDHDQGPDRGHDQGRGNGGGHNWKRGQRMQREDWNRGQHIDYREHHLRRPPRGYEWREVDGTYVLAAAATGLIASIIANAAR